MRSLCPLLQRLLLGEAEAILRVRAKRSLCETFVSAVSPSPLQSLSPGVCNLYFFFTKSLVHSILPSNSGIKNGND